MALLTHESRMHRMLICMLALASVPALGRAQVPVDSVAVPLAATPSDTAPARADTAATDTLALTSAPREPLVPGVTVGSVREDYLRTLQAIGVVRPYPWSIRGFSPRELELLRARSDSHPRAAGAEFRPVPRGWYGIQFVPVTADAWFNSGFAYGMNDGAVWRGRGLTTAASGGVQGRWGPVSLTLAPEAFWTQNRSFDLFPNDRAGDQQFADGQYSSYVDLPQRFGDGAYAVLDWGQSSLRVDTRFVAAGISTANQAWGPMTKFPYILGNNAGGFPHAFIGSGQPLNVFIGTVHGRVLYGELAQSAFSPASNDASRRFATGIIGLFSPRGVPTLEIGVGRFFHLVWPDSGLTSWEFRRPFEAILKANLPIEQQAGDDTLTHVENQLASLFFRWVFPNHGLDIYGEFGREDHSWDRRDLLLQLEHSGTYGFGLRKAWKGAHRIRVLGAETMNFQIRSGGLHRGEGGIYLHSPIQQGHTYRGQLLGAGFGVGSASGTTLTLEEHRDSSATTVTWSRIVRMEYLAPWVQSAPWILPDRSDVQHVLEVSHRMDRGGRQIRLGLGAVYEFDRNLRDDAFNLMLSGGIDLFPR